VGFCADLFDKLQQGNGKSNPYIQNVTLAPLPRPEVDQNPIKLYVGGPEIAPAIGQYIENADQEVLIQTYNLDHESDFWKEIMAALIALNEKAQGDNKEISVKIMVNMRVGPAAWATKSKSDPFEPWLKKNEREVYEITEGQCKTQVPNLKIKTVLHKHKSFNAYHSKVYVIDNKTVILCSGDPVKNSNYKNVRKGRTETATSIASPFLAKQLGAAFKYRFNKNRRRHPPVPRKFVKYGVTQANPGKLLLLVKSPSTDPLKRSLFFSPYKIAILEAIHRANKCIDIMMSNINDRDIIKALTKAANRGVKINVITGKWHCDSRETKPFMGGTNQAAIARLFKFIKKQYWDNVRVHWAIDSQQRLLQDDSDPRLGADASTTEVVHGKMVLVDEKWVLTGSSPLDMQALYHSAECDVLIEDETIAKEYKRRFNEVFNVNRDAEWHPTQQLPGNNAQPYPINFDGELFARLQNTIVKHLQRKVLKRLETKTYSIKKHSDYTNLTNEKIQDINALITSVSTVQTRRELYQLLNESSKDSNDNKLSHYRTGFFFRADPTSHGKTKTIRLLYGVMRKTFRSAERRHYDEQAVASHAPSPVSPQTP